MTHRGWDVNFWHYCVLSVPILNVCIGLSVCIHTVKRPRAGGGMNAAQFSRRPARRPRALYFGKYLTAFAGTQYDGMTSSSIVLMRLIDCN